MVFTNYHETGKIKRIADGFSKSATLIPTGLIQKLPETQRTLF